MRQKEAVQGVLSRFANISMVSSRNVIYTSLLSPHPTLIPSIHPILGQF